MEIHLKKGVLAYITFPMVTTASPETFDTGETVTDTGYYKDGTGSWTSLTITDTVSEISTTGMYWIELTASEMDHDLIAIKFTSTNAADTMVMIRTFAVDQDDLVRATTPANTLDVNATGEAGADVLLINGQTTAAANLQKGADTAITGSFTGTPGTTSGNTGLTGYANDQLIGRPLYITSGNADGEATLITDYAETNGVLTYEELTTAPAASDTFYIG